MPFSKYFQDVSDPDPQRRPPHDADEHAPPDHPFSHAVRFQVPEFIYSAAPTLAPGGGAEVLPAGAYHAHDLDQPWLSQPWYSPLSHSPKAPSAPPSSTRHDRAHPHILASSAPLTHLPFPHDISMFLNPAVFPSIPPSPLDLVSIDTNTNTNTGNPDPSASGQTAPGPSPAAHTLARPRDPSQDHNLTSSINTLPIPSASGLPIYSTSGFDLLSIFSRVATRLNPTVDLGPVDLSCSFVLVDTRRYDHPIVYCSPTFCTLTGYAEHETIGRNCRFLQAPYDRPIKKGELRKYTSHKDVEYMRKCLSADKECQVSLMNYRKDGTAFLNRVTVIPVPGDDKEVIYHIGFQVDLGSQPGQIAQKLYGGTYGPQAAIGSTTMTQASSLNAGRNRNPQHTIPSTIMSQDLKKILANPNFLKSIPISTSTVVASNSVPSNSIINSTNVSASTAVASSTGAAFTSAPSTSASTSSQDRDVSLSNTQHQSQNHLLNLILLEALPDFIHVVSLKGSFLYVAPSVRRVLGYEPEELVGKSIADFTHPEDVVPVMRELKESSATGPSAIGLMQQQHQQQEMAGMEAAALSTAPMVPSSSSSSSLAAVGPTTTTTAPLAAPATATSLTAAGNNTLPLPQPFTSTQPRTVDLIFRARVKSGVYVWVESRGRLHVEPGKGRKAIVLSGRAKMMPRLEWREVGLAGGVRVPVPASGSAAEAEKVRAKGKGKEREVEEVMDTDHIDDGGGGGGGGGGSASIAGEAAAEAATTTLVEQEFWGMLSSKGTFLVVGSGVRDVLGWQVSEVVGRAVGEMVVGSDAEGDSSESNATTGGENVAEKDFSEEVLRDLELLSRSQDTAARVQESESTPLNFVSPAKRRVVMKKRDGSGVPVELVLYRTCPTNGELKLQVQQGDMGILGAGVGANMLGLNSATSGSLLGLGWGSMGSSLGSGVEGIGNATANESDNGHSVGGNNGNTGGFGRGEVYSSIANGGFGLGLGTDTTPSSSLLSSSTQTGGQQEQNSNAGASAAANGSTLGPGVISPPIVYQVKLISPSASLPSGAVTEMGARTGAVRSLSTSHEGTSLFASSVASLAAEADGMGTNTTGGTTGLHVPVSPQSAGDESRPSTSASLASALGPASTTETISSRGLVHNLNSNVFEELEVGRGSSWQYELQQLRFANQRLLEEVNALEAEIKAVSGTPANVNSSLGVEGSGGTSTTQAQSVTGPTSATVQPAHAVPTSEGVINDANKDTAGGLESIISSEDISALYSGSQTSALYSTQPQIQVQPPQQEASTQYEQRVEYQYPSQTQLELQAQMQQLTSAIAPSSPASSSPATSMATPPQLYSLQPALSGYPAMRPLSSSTSASMTPNSGSDGRSRSVSVSAFHTPSLMHNTMNQSQGRQVLALIAQPQPQPATAAVSIPAPVTVSPAAAAAAAALLQPHPAALPVQIQVPLQQLRGGHGIGNVGLGFSAGVAPPQAQGMSMNPVGMGLSGITVPSQAQVQAQATSGGRPVVDMGMGLDESGGLNSMALVRPPIVPSQASPSTSMMLSSTLSSPYRSLGSSSPSTASPVPVARPTQMQGASMPMSGSPVPVSVPVPAPAAARMIGSGLKRSWSAIDK